MHRSLSRHLHNVWPRASALEQLSKFGLVGILNTVIGYGLFVFFLNWYNYFGSLIISHIIAVTHSYLWNKLWTFKSNNNLLKEFIKFNSVYLIIFIGNAVMLFYLVNIANFDPRIAQLFILPIITIISFTGHKYWSFK
jgi:putative flippase GtrA